MGIESGREPVKKQRLGERASVTGNDENATKRLVQSRNPVKSKNRNQTDGVKSFKEPNQGKKPGERVWGKKKNTKKRGGSRGTPCGEHDCTKGEELQKMRGSATKKRKG